MKENGRSKWDRNNQRWFAKVKLKKIVEILRVDLLIDDTNNDYKKNKKNELLYLSKRIIREYKCYASLLSQHFTTKANLSMKYELNHTTKSTIFFLFRFPSKF